jgi:hypothetical protein
MGTGKPETKERRDNKFGRLAASEVEVGDEIAALKHGATGNDRFKPQPCSSDAQPALRLSMLRSTPSRLRDHPLLVSLPRGVIDRGQGCLFRKGP